MPNSRAIIWCGLVACFISCAERERQSSAERPTSATPEVAEGLEFLLWAREPDVVNPTSIDVDSRGRVWIAEGVNYRLFSKAGEPFRRQPGADRIKILEDTDGDGKADKVTVFASDLFPVPMGLAVQEIWRDGAYRGARIFIGNSPDLLVLEDLDGDDHADRRSALLTGFHGVDSDHGLHGMALGHDGKITFTHGDARYGRDAIEGGAFTFDVTDKSGRRLRCNRYGTTLRVNLDGTDLEVLSVGFRNNYDACLDSFGHVFVSDNDDDGNRGCRMAWVLEGGDFGYRVPGSIRHSAEELPGVVPKVVGTGNGAPSGILVYEGNLLPGRYHGAVIQLDAGSSRVNAHPLVRHGAAFRSDIEPILRWEDGRFRPTDAAVAPDGSIYMCDWHDAGVGGNRFSDQSTGRIYRIAPVGVPPSVPRAAFSSVAGAVLALESPNVATQFAARQILLTEGARAREALLGLYRSGRPYERARCLFVLADLPVTGRSDLVAALSDKDPRIRELGLRLLLRSPGNTWVVGPRLSGRGLVPGLEGEVLEIARDPDGGVRRQLILGLSEVETSKAGPALAILASGWDGKDRFYLEALRLALRGREPEFLEGLFSEAARKAVVAGWGDGPVALPPFYPVSSNDAFLRPKDILPDANEVSKVIGLAWAVERSEALPAIRSILERNASPHVARGTDIALDRIADPRAAELLVDQFLKNRDIVRRRAILGRLESNLDGRWKVARDGHKLREALEVGMAQKDLRMETIRTIAGGRVDGFESRLMELAGNDREDIPTRSAAVEALGRFGHEPARSLMERWVAEAKGRTQGGSLALSALTVLTDWRGSEAIGMLEGILSDPAYPLDLRRRAVQRLAASFRGGARLLDLSREKRVPEDLHSESAFLLANHPDRAVREKAADATAAFFVARPRRILDMKTVLAIQGDLGRGRKLFFEDAQIACARCHRVQGAGGSVGPDLSTVGAKYGREEILYHILNPSGAINYNYVANTIQLTDGRVLSGIVADDSEERIILKTAQGERVEILRHRIERRKAQELSLMPENVAEVMSARDLADLVEFLAALRRPSASAEEYHVLGPIAGETFDPTTKPNMEQPLAAGDGKEVRWRRVASDPDARLSLLPFVGGKEGSEVYCYVPVVSSSRQEATVILAASGEVDLRVDGRPVKLQARGRSGRDAIWEGSVVLEARSHWILIRAAVNGSDPGLTTAVISEVPVRFGRE